MKKLIMIAFLIVTIDLYSQQVQGQDVNTNVNIKKERELALKPEATVINIPLEADLSKYKKIVLSVQGWSAKQNEKDIRNALKQSIFNVDKKNFEKGVTKMEEDAIYFFWFRTNDLDDRTTTIILRDFNMKVLYSATHINVGRAKMLDFILNQ
jgi:predicted transcriptional regulator